MNFPVVKIAQVIALSETTDTGQFRWRKWGIYLSVVVGKFFVHVNENFKDKNISFKSS